MAVFRPTRPRLRCLKEISGCPCHIDLHHRRCSARVLHLSVERYREATANLRCIAEQVGLDLQLRAAKQDQSKWRLFLQRLREEEPAFTYHPDCLPTVWYWNSWTDRFKCEQRAVSAISYDSPSGAHTSFHTDLDAPPGDGLKITMEPEEDYLNPDGDDYGPLPPTSQKAVSSASYDRVYPEPEPEPLSRMTGFRAELQKLTPRLDDLYLQFQLTGVNDMKALRTLASFPDADRVSFMRHDMKLNAFQCRSVLVALRSFTE